MKNATENLSAVCEEAIGNMGAIVRLDNAVDHVRFGGSPEGELRSAQEQALREVQESFADIRTDDLTNDRLDLITSFAVGELGLTGAELIVRDALVSRIKDWRTQYDERQKQLAKQLRGQWLAVSMLADELVFRTRWNTGAPALPPILSGDTVFMKLRHAPGDDGFITYKTGRPDKNARNYIGYAISGATRRGTGGGFADISLVDTDGSPVVNIMPLASKPPRVTRDSFLRELH